LDSHSIQNRFLHGLNCIALWIFGRYWREASEQQKDSTLLFYDKDTRVIQAGIGVEAIAFVSDVRSINVSDFYLSFPHLD